jgi:hypothetical protein
VGILGKQGRVEGLIEGILKDIHVITCERLIGTATGAQVKEIEAAIKQMNEMPSSLQDEAGGVTQTHSGSGDNIGHSGSGNIYAGESHHNQNTGDVNYGSKK